MLHIVPADNGYVSSFVCDVCAQRFVTAGEAVVIMRSGGEVWHVHKGQCHGHAERTEPDSNSGSMPLDVHMLQLWCSLAPTKPDHSLSIAERLRNAEAHATHWASVALGLAELVVNNAASSAHVFATALDSSEASGRRAQAAANSIRHVLIDDLFNSPPKEFSDED